MPYFGDENRFNNEYRIGGGCEYIPNYQSKAFFSKMKYRAGVHYNNSYLRMNQTTANPDGDSYHDVKTVIAKKVGEDEYLLSGRVEIDALNEKFELDLPESDDYVTIAGFILFHYQDFPKLNESVVIDKYTFKIIKVTATKIELVRMKIAK